MKSILENILFEALAGASDYVYIFVTDMNTGVTRWSQNAVEYFALPEEYMENMNKFWPAVIHPDDVDIYLTDIDRVITGVSTRHSCQYRARNRYGQYVWVECKGRLESDKEGQAIFAGMMTRLDCQSKYDYLTGLETKNEFYALDLLNETGVVAMYGIDYFKKIINTYGYDNGDDILVQLGKKFLQIFGKENKVFRFAGDEFIVVLPNGTEESATALFHEIQEKAGNVTLNGGQKINLTYSGAAICYPTENHTKDDIVHKLMIAMDKAKKTNRGGMTFYSKEIFDKEKRINILKRELKESISNDFKGFELYYQPWMNQDGTQIVGCEALLRWKGTEITDSYPSEFIPILEETDDIIKVGRFVMREAMRQQKCWEEKYGEIIVSFNVSYEQFLEETFIDNIVQTVNEYGVDPLNIVIELTESCSVQSPESLANVFTELKKLGFNIALDDFGTGYSSLEMLRLLPTDGIKIEHTFVRELSDEGHEVDYAIINSILFLCHELGQAVVIEGVENAEVESIVRKMNVGYLQGYYYSKPICCKEFEKLLEENIRKIAYNE